MGRLTLLLLLLLSPAWVVCLAGVGAALGFSFVLYGTVRVIRDIFRGA